MTILEALKHAGIEAVEDNYGWRGKTKSGKAFYLDRAGGAYGLQFTLDIEGLNKVTHCLFRTAVKKIKTN